MNATEAFNLRRDPLRLVFSKAPWTGAWFLFASLFTGSALFAIALAAVTGGAALGLTLVGIPLLITAAGVIRWCADAERTRLRPLLGGIAARYRETTGPGLLAWFDTRWRDPATWRDVGYLLGLYVPLFVLDGLVLTIWLTLLAGITLPIWYWAPWQTIHGVRYHGYQLGVFPNGPHGHPAYGFYIDTLSRALLAAAVSLILFLLFNYVLVATARLHASTARALLSTPEDPLREAKEILSQPGPLFSDESAAYSGIPNER
jgi:Putative sensor